MGQIPSTVSHAHNHAPLTEVGFFLELLQPSYEDDRVESGLPVGHALSQSEEHFLLQLLTPQSFRDLLKKSPGSLANSSNEPSQSIDKSSILQLLQESNENISSKNKIGISTVVSDPDTSLSR